MLKITKMYFYKFLRGNNISLPAKASLVSVPLEPRELPSPEFEEDFSVVDPKLALPFDTSLSIALKENRDSLGQILEFLPMKEIVAVAVTTKFFAESLRANELKIESAYHLPTLFDAIDRGKELAVKKMLDELKASHPRRLSRILSSTARAAFTDHAGRTFDAITPLQFAAWNLDTPMRDLLRSYMSEEEMAEQIDALDKKRIDYSIPLSDFKRLSAMAPEHAAPIQRNVETPYALDSKEEEDDSDPFVTLNEKHYDWGFRVLQSALQTYLDVYIPMAQRSEFNWNLLTRYWFDAGFAQRYLTVPYVNAYCCATRIRPLARPIVNYAIPPERITAFYNWTKGKEEDFFDALIDSKLGFSFGIVNSLEDGLRKGRASARAKWIVLANLEAINHLSETITDDYKVLVEAIHPALSLPVARFSSG